MTLSKRKLHGQGFEVSALELGCMLMSQSYSSAHENESIATLRRAIELGCTFFDAAESNGPFTNQELLGQAFRSRRAEVNIATKFGSRLEGNRSTRTPCSIVQSIPLLVHTPFTPYRLPLMRARTGGKESEINGAAVARRPCSTRLAGNSSRWSNGIR